MEEKKIDELLKESLAAKESPELELNEKILQRIDTFERKKRKVISFPISAVVAASVLFLLVVLGGTVFQDNVKAMMEKLFGPITENYVYGGKEQKKQVEEEVCKVGETVTRQGLAVTLEEVLLDANKVAYCVKVHSDERWGMPLTYANIVSHVYVNKQKIVDNPSYVSWTADDHTQVIVGEVALNPGMNLKGDVSLQIQVTDVCTTPAISDKWNFETVVNVDRANEHTTKDLTTTVMKLTTGDVLTIHKVVCTSTDCKVYMTLETERKNKDDVNLHLDGEDNLGERISDDNCTVKKVKGKHEYEVVASFTGGFGKKVKKLRLAPYWMDFAKHKYQKIGEDFTVILK